MGNWSNALNKEQIQYAAADAAASIDVYHHLKDMPDFSRRLQQSEIIADTVVHIVPGHGNVTIMNSRAAVAVIKSLQSGTQWKNPFPGIYPSAITHSAIVKKKLVLVTITKVIAPSLTIPNLFATNTKGSNVCLKDLSQYLPFEVLVPVTMLAPFIPNVRIEPTISSASSSSLPAASSLLTSTLPFSTSTSTTPTLTSSTESSTTATIESMPTSSVPFGQPWLEALTQGDDEDFEDLQFVDDGALNPQEVQRFIELAQQCASAAESNSIDDCNELGSAPHFIDDIYSSILGDMFHFMDRAKVPVHHESKKAFYYCLSEAMLIWDPIILDKVKNNLKKEGLSEREIEDKMYFDTYYFTQRVPRTAPPPSIMYPRVRAVYALFGNKRSSKGVPLFTAANWNKAKNVLAEILAGHASDPPGVSFYTQQINSKGVPIIIAIKQLKYI